MTTRCPHCGTANRAGSNYCNQCGAALQIDETTREQPDHALSTAPSAGTEGPSPDKQFTLPASNPLGDQPWLYADTEAEQTTAELSAEAREASLATPKRLISNIQGLLEPLRVFSSADEESESSSLRPPPPLSPDVEQLRRLRVMMSEEPTLAEPSALASASPHVHIQIPWLFWLLGLLIAFPLLTNINQFAGVAHQWPGVAEAYTTLAALPSAAPVQIFWAYDPATAGEMDLVAQPVIAHLLELQSDVAVVTITPYGPATARRLFAKVIADLPGAATQRGDAGLESLVTTTFLPTGGGALPLVGQDWPASLNAQAESATPNLRRVAGRRPLLAVLIAAQAEDVQRWLEQVQPLNQVEVVAFTSASADPLLRPYLDSGQLQGLVSGFDGAQSYQRLRGRALSEEASTAARQQLSGQNWAHWGLLLAILLGNLAALVGRAP
jgi:hypothetical protein